MECSDSVAVENFREYLRIKTVQPNPDYVGAVQFLKKMADQLKLKYEVREFVAGKPVVLMTWFGTQPDLPTLLLNSHVDVVPVFREFWKYDPFEAVMEDNGDIFARGSQDMKCVGIQYLEAIRRLQAEGYKPTRTVHLSFVPDEEIGGQDGMQAFIATEYFKQLNIGFALDEGLANNGKEFMVYFGERRDWWVTVTCSGKPGHGSLFIEDNAGEKLRQVLNNFLSFRDSEEKRLLTDHLTLGEVTTVNLTKIQGGVQTNVVPTELKATFDIRISPYVDLEQFEQKIKAWCSQAGPNVTYQFDKRGMCCTLTSTKSDNPWWVAFNSVFTEMKLDMKLEIFPAATDSRFLRQIGLPAIGFSPMNDTPVLLHDHNEKLNSAVFLRGIPIYTSLISRLADQLPAPAAEH